MPLTFFFCLLECGSVAFNLIQRYLSDDTLFYSALTLVFIYNKTSLNTFIVYNREKNVPFFLSPLDGKKVTFPELECWWEDNGKSEVWPSWRSDWKEGIKPFQKPSRSVQRRGGGLRGLYDNKKRNERKKEKVKRGKRRRKKKSFLLLDRARKETDDEGEKKRFLPAVPGGCGGMSSR